MKNCALLLTTALMLTAPPLDAQMLPAFMEAAKRSKALERLDDAPAVSAEYTPVDPETLSGTALTNPHDVAPSARTHGEAPWTTLGIVHANYEAAAQDYSDTVSRSHRYYLDNDPNVYFEYTLAGGREAGNNDTIKYEHRVYDEELEWYTFDLAYEMIGGEMVLTKRNVGYLEWETENEKVIYLHDTSFTTVVANYSDNGNLVPYLQSTRRQINLDGGKLQHFSSVTMRKDGTLYQSLDKITKNQKLIYRKFSSYDQNGEVIEVEKDSMEYDDNGRMLYRIFQRSTDDISYNTVLEYKLTLDDQGRVAQELDMSGNRQRSTYTWEGDQLSQIFVERRYANNEAPWENYRRYTYNYEGDSTFEIEEHWDRFNEVWNTYLRNIYIDHGNYGDMNLLVSRRADYVAGLDAFVTILIDSIHYETSADQPTAVYTYVMEDKAWISGGWQEMIRDDKGRVLEEVIFDPPGTGLKNIYRYNDPVNPDRATTMEYYSAMDFVDQIPTNWKLKSKTHYSFYQHAKEMYVLAENMSWNFTSGGYYWKRVVNSENLTEQIIDSETSDTDASDGVDWWTERYDEYEYNEDHQLLYIRHYLRASEGEPLLPSFFYEWTYHENGLPDDFFLVNHAMDPPAPSRKYEWTYDEDPLDVHCALTIAGDTLITDGSVTLSALFDDATARYSWKDGAGTAIGSGPSQVVDTRGTYTLTGMKIGCITGAAIDIYAQCPLDVEGDTIIYRTGDAELQATLHDVVSPQYNWYTEGGDLAGGQSVLSVGEAGTYNVVATGDHCYSTGSLRVRLVTSADPYHNDGNWRLYPNPALHSASLVVPEAVRSGMVTLHDELGRPVRSFELLPGKNVLNMDLASLPSGLYVLSLVDDAVTYRQRLMIR